MCVYVSSGMKSPKANCCLWIMCVCVCVCVSKCVCLFTLLREFPRSWLLHNQKFVCVCEREREKEKKRERERETVCMCMCMCMFMFVYSYTLLGEVPRRQLLGHQKFDPALNCRDFARRTYTWTHQRQQRPRRLYHSRAPCSGGWFRSEVVVALVVIEYIWVYMNNIYIYIYTHQNKRIHMYM